MNTKYSLVLVLFLCSFLGFGQIATQSFETSGDTWSYTSNRGDSTLGYDLGSDEWHPTTNQSGKTPSDGTNLWGFQDIDNDTYSGDHILEFSVVDISNHINVTVDFDWFTESFNATDILGYQVNYDNSGWSSTILCTGCGTTQADGSLSSTETINVPDSVDNIEFRLYANQNGGNQHGGFDNIIIDGTLAAPTPEIEIQGNSTEIADGDNVPDLGDDTDFGNVAVAGGMAVNSFTILNTGTAGLTLTDASPYVSLSGSGDFTLTATPTSPIAASSSTTFNITFNPSSTTLQQAVVSIANDDGNEDPYTFTIQGLGVNSSDSDIIVSPSFTYNSNIDYTAYQAVTITNTMQSVDVVRIDIRDGGAANDPDILGTTLTGIVFDVVNIDTIRSAALFNGNTQINNAPTISVPGNTISFSGLNYTAPDDGQASLTLRITFDATVTDNDQLQFTVNSATANTTGSVFASANAGGAMSSILNNRNRIEVTADRLHFSQQPSNTSANAVMTPFVEVSATDIFNNIDLDWSGLIDLSSSGTMTGEPITQAATNGSATYTSVIHTVPGTGLTLNASTTGLTSATSNNFVINTFTFSSGDFRPLFPTNLSFNGEWEYYNGSTWISTAGSGWDGNAPQNTSTTINRILIDDYVNGGGSSSNNYDCDILILNGGTLEIVDNDNPPIAAEFLSAGNTLEVQSGGILIIRGDIDLASTTNLFVRDGGEMVIDQASMTNDHPIWDGIEKFEGGSMLEINNWDWTASPIVRSLINVVTTITNNDNGYKFGNVYFNPTNLLTDWAIVGGPVNVNVTENDFEINNTSSFFVLGMSNSSANISSTYGGNILVSDGAFTFGGSFSNGNFDQEFTIMGDVIINNDDPFYIHRTFNGTPTIVPGSAPVTIEGNLEVWGLTTTLTSNVSTKELLFSGNNTHTIEVAPNCSNSSFIIESGDTAILLNENLKFTGNSSLEIENAATFDFSFNSGGAGTTALEVQNISGGNNRFLQQAGAYLYITHPQGIWDANINGNVQNFSATNTTYNQNNSIYHYIGKTNQETGDAFSAGSTSKTLIAELTNTTDALTVTETTGTSTLLEIRNGIVVVTDANHIYGSGDLTISGGGLRSSVVTSTSVVPSLTGTYNLTAGFVQLNASTDQVLRGSRAYRDLVFSTSGIKTVSSAPSSVTGTILTEDAAILDVENNTMGGAGTDLTMTGTSEYITAGTGTKPDATGLYTLGVGTKVTFTNNQPGLQSIRLNSGSDTPYYNVDIEGSNVGTNTLATGIRFQSGGTFTVKNTGVFKFINTNGFYDAANIDRAISNLNNPNIVLDPGSTVEYAGASQFFSDFIGYKNVTVSGTGVKSFLPPVGGITVEENFNILSSTVDVKGDAYFGIASEYISVGGNTFVDNGATLDIDTSASFVQTGIDGAEGTFTIATGGTARVTKRTSEFDAATGTIFYTYWSSPINNPGNVDAVFPGAFDDRRFYYEASAFIDSEIEVGNNNGTIPGQDDIDDDGNDWRDANGAVPMEVGRGYAVTAFLPPPPLGPFTDNTTFTGTFNTGNITVPIYKNNNEIDDNNWNFIGNPYPSAISAQAFLDENAVIDDDPTNLGGMGGALFFWSQISDPEADNNGNENINFSQNDYAIMNGVSGIAGGATTSAPSPYIPSGQGFFVSYEDAPTDVEGNTITTGSVIFKNDMRVTDNNTQFFQANDASQDINTSQDELGEANKLWLNLTSDNGVFSQTNITYIDNASNGYDGWYYDTPRNLSNGPFSALYSTIEDRDEKFAIQAKNSESLSPEEFILLGFYTNIDEATIYSISIGDLEGIFLTDNPIYLKDNLLNTIHNLKESDYNFTSSTGTFNDRFEIVFTDDTLSTNVNSLNANDLTIIEHSNGQVQFKVTGSSIMKIIEIMDLQGKTVYTFNVTNNTNATYNLPSLSNAAYIAKVTFKDGQTIIKKDIKRF